MKLTDIFVCKGNGSFSKENFRPVQNSSVFWVKPKGGLWSSPENAPYGWEDWAKDNNFSCNLDEEFRFRLSAGAKVLEITNARQLDDLPKLEHNNKYSWVALDFEALARKYDAMLVMISNDQQLYWDLYGWDCDTLLVFNPDVIRIID